MHHEDHEGHEEAEEEKILKHGCQEEWCFPPRALHVLRGA